MYCILFDGTFSFFKFERWVVAAQHTNGANMVEATEDEQDENADTKGPMAELQVKKYFYWG